MIDPDAPIRWRATWPDDPKTHDTDGVAYAGEDQIGRVHYVDHVDTLHGTGWHWSVTDPRIDRQKVRDLSGQVSTKDGAKGEVEGRWRAAMRAGAVWERFRGELREDEDGD